MPHSDAEQTILIIDDEPASMKALQAALSKEDYNFFWAANGEMAFDMIKGGLVPDLILLDVVMPGLDGFEIYHRLKKDPKTQHIPLIFLTAKLEASEEARGLEMGAVDYIRKPFSLPIIRARVRNHLELKKTRDTLESLSILDGLTNVSNRRRFEEIYRLEWHRASRTQSPLCVLFVDIDHFKYYNDLYGHLVGDQCLRTIAQALQSSLGRPADFLARFGGEEFIILLPDTDQHGCLCLVQNILKAINALRLEHKASPVAEHVTVSIGGVCCASFDSYKRIQILEKADKLLYKAKENGRNRGCIQFIPATGDPEAARTILSSGE